MTLRYLLCAVLAVAFAAESWAFVVARTPGPVGNPRRWQLAATNPNVHTNIVNPATRAIRYYLASDGYSATNTAAELNALRASFDQWQLVPGTALRFEEAGMAAPGIDVSDDDSNIVFFARSSTLVNGGTSDIRGISAATFYTFLSDGTMVEADIVFNAVEFEWFADFSSTNTLAHFIEGVALHEIGAMAGLAYSPLGGATMMRLGGPGVNQRTGLSADEISAARALYPASGQMTSLGMVRGTITKNGSPVLGGVVVLEQIGSGNAVAGTLSRLTGSYELPALDPGTYNIRVVPLDPGSAPEALMRGVDISPEFTSADSSFLPTTNRTVTVVAGATNVVDFTLQNATPAFRIAYLRVPTTSSGLYQRSGLPAMLRPGQTNWTVGVGSSNLPTSGATLSITGDGLTVGPSILLNVGGQHFISARVSVASNATPGLRTFVVRDGANLAYANGFLEIAPLNPDYDYDGLPDSFQRQYFSRFTVPQADPGADPDGDSVINSAEHRAGTNPTNNSSFLKIESVTHTVSGATVTWRSVAGKRYQLHQKPVLTDAGWSPVGTPVTATGLSSQQLDPAGAAATRFYRVEVLP